MRAIVIGASGFGKVHVRELLHAGVRSLDIVGQRRETVEKMACELSETYKLTIRGFDRLERALDSEPDIVSICTPTNSHCQFLEQLLSLDCGVLCEKPFIWSENLSGIQLEGQLRQLIQLNGRLSVNYCNSLYTRLALSRMPNTEGIQKLLFRFHTNGHHVFEEIGVDLLPHALSALQEIKEIQHLSSISTGISRHKYQCHFFADNIECFFEFAQGSNIPKNLTIGLNDRIFVRDSFSVGDFYEAGLFDQEANERFTMIDPTRQVVSAFVEAIRLGYSPPLGFNYASQNTRLMQRLMNRG